MSNLLYKKKKKSKIVSEDYLIWHLGCDGGGKGNSLPKFYILDTFTSYRFEEFFTTIHSIQFIDDIYIFL